MTLTDLAAAWLARVRQRLLRDAIEGDLGGLGQARQSRARHLEIDRKPMEAGHLDAQPLERLLEPEIVEDARTKAAGDALHAVEGGRHRCPQGAGSFAGLPNLLGLLDGPQADQERRQGLRGLVVELAGDAPPLLLLRGDDVVQQGPDGLLGAASFGDVAVDADIAETRARAVIESHGARLDVDALAVSTPVRQLAVEAARLDEPLDGLGPLDADEVGVKDERVRLSEDLVGSAAVSGLGGRVPRRHDELVIARDDRVGDRREQQIQMARLGLRPPQKRHVGDGDELGRHSGEGDPERRELDVDQRGRTLLAVPPDDGIGPGAASVGIDRQRPSARAGPSATSMSTIDIARNSSARVFVVPQRRAIDVHDPRGRRDPHRLDVLREHAANVRLLERPPIADVVGRGRSAGSLRCFVGHGIDYALIAVGGWMIRCRR